jgi:hypothetical protein
MQAVNLKAHILLFLEELGVRRHRIIGGTPSSNGMVERSNLSLKVIMARIKKNKTNESKNKFPNWYNLLEEYTASSNQAYHSAIKMRPKDAIELKDGEVIKEMTKK